MLAFLMFVLSRRCWSPLCTLTDAPFAPHELHPAYLFLKKNEPQGLDLADPCVHGMATRISISASIAVNLSKDVSILLGTKLIMGIAMPYCELRNPKPETKSH
jgi:hypothetical protein